MMHFHLRTLLIVLALGPPVLAGLWLYKPVLRAAVFVFSVRDALWLALLIGLTCAWWIRHHRSRKKIDALANRLHQARN
jgi:hypothetical protein